MDFPLLVGLAMFVVLALWALGGDAVRNRGGRPNEEERSDSGLLLSSTLTLLFLIVGFSFSMALSRYDIRKNCEQAEAIMITTAYTRADLLTPADGANMRMLLKKYLDQRVLFYTTRSSDRVAEIDAETARLQAELWSTVRPAIAAIPPPLMGLLISAVNDVANSQRGTQGAWLNRIPIAAWALMAAIATGCCWLIAYRACRRDWLEFLVVPTAVAISFFLIADLDSPRGGAIRLTPLNLSSLAQSMRVQ